MIPHGADSGEQQRKREKEERETDTEREETRLQPTKKEREHYAECTCVRNIAIKSSSRASSFGTFANGAPLLCSLPPPQRTESGRGCPQDRRGQAWSCQQPPKFFFCRCRGPTVPLAVTRHTRRHHNSISTESRSAVVSVPLFHLFAYHLALALSSNLCFIKMHSA